MLVISEYKGTFSCFIQLVSALLKCVNPIIFLFEAFNMRVDNISINVTVPFAEISCPKGP